MTTRYDNATLRELLCIEVPPSIVAAHVADELPQTVVLVVRSSKTGQPYLLPLTVSLNLAVLERMKLAVLVYMSIMQQEGVR